jgi:hypothetical protein
MTCAPSLYTPLVPTAAAVPHNRNYCPDANEDKEYQDPTGRVPFDREDEIGMRLGKVLELGYRGS